MELNETTVKTQRVYDGKLLKVHHDDITLANGTPAWREWVQHPGGVIVVPILEDRNGERSVVMMEQYRYPVRRVMFELPAGLMDVPGETVEQAAKRELLEETGYTAERLTPLGRYYSQSGFCTDHCDIVLAQGLTPGQAQPEEDERMRIFTLPMDQAMHRCRSEPVDARTLLALMLANQELLQAT